jgi:hypothetical protein
MSKHEIESDDDMSLEELATSLSKDDRKLFTAMSRYLEAKLDRFTKEISKHIESILIQFGLDGVITGDEDREVLLKIQEGVLKLLEQSKYTVKKPNGTKAATINTWFALQYAIDQILRKKFPHTKEMEAKADKYEKGCKKWYETLARHVYKTLTDEQKEDVKKYRAVQAEVAEDITPDDQSDSEAPKKPSKKKTSAGPADSDSEEESAKPAKKKKAKKAQPDDESDAQPAKKSKKTKKSAKHHEDDEDDEEPKKKPAARAAKDPSADSGSDEEEPVASKTKKAKKAKKKAKKAPSDSESEDEEAPAKKKKAKKAPADSDSDEEAPKKKKTKKSK